MTYRTAPPPIERPRVNPMLERELLAYHRRHRRRDVVTIGIALCCLLPAVVGALASPTNARAVTVFGVPGLFGLGIGLWSLWTHRPQLLERLRTGIPIHDVRRGTALAEDVKPDFPTLHVDFKDGRTASLVCLGGENDRITRIELLLRIQMGNGDERLVERLGELFQQVAARVGQ